MATRELQNVLNSGELTNIYLRGTTQGSRLLTADEVQVGLSEQAAGINEKLAATNEPTGFDRRSPNSMGIIECCPIASEGLLLRIDQNGVYSETPGQTTFGDGTTPLSDHTMIIRPVDVITPLVFWLNGIKITKSTTQKVVVDLLQSGVLLFFFDETGKFSYGYSPVAYSFTKKVVVSAVCFNALTGKKVMFGDERHGNSMNGDTHEYLHRTEGTKFSEGAEISGLASNVGTFTSITSGVFFDEDIELLATNFSAIPFLYKEGIGDSWNLSTVVDNQLGYKPSGVTVYNLNTGGTWSLASITNGYVLTHFLFTGDKKYPYVKVIGQDRYSSRTDARLRASNDIRKLQLDGLPTPEFKFLFTVIVKDATNGLLEVGTDGEIFIDHRYGHPISVF